ncbi:UNVERIFIED_CONTAM: hypothetical protein GTU68_045943 [Idotea baltica]
MRVTP